MIIILQLQRVKNSLKKTDRFTSKKKIYLYKEDFSAFAEILGDMTAYVLNHKGEEVISKDIRKISKEYNTEKVTTEEALPNISSFTDIDFDDI
jgi:hypothetical protein